MCTGELLLLHHMRLIQDTVHTHVAGQTAVAHEPRFWFVAAVVVGTTCCIAGICKSCDQQAARGRLVSMPIALPGEELLQLPALSPSICGPGTHAASEPCAHKSLCGSSGCCVCHATALSEGLLATSLAAVCKLQADIGTGIRVCCAVRTGSGC